MNELISYANIDMTRPLSRLVPFEAGIWHCALYATGELLDFMVDTYNRIPINVNNVIVNNIEWENVVLNNEELELSEKLHRLRVLPGSKAGWFQDGAIVYIRFHNWDTPLLYYSAKYGRLYGFTNGSPKLVDGMMYRPGLLTSPVVEQSADAFTYDKMKFNSASVSIDNTNGQFDDVNDFFGNEFNVLVGENKEEDRKSNENIIQLFNPERPDQVITLNAETEKLVVLSGSEEKNGNIPLDFAQYYIANIVTGLEKATFSLKDKRERLSGKIPNDKFDTIRYPDIEDNLIDKDMQEAYGYCFGVPGICLQGKIMNGNGSLGQNIQYRFRFSSEISRVDRIEVNLPSGEFAADVAKPDINKVKMSGWTTAYQRKRPALNSPDDWPGSWPSDGSGRWNPMFKAGDIVTRKLYGEITLDEAISKPGGGGSNKPNEVRMDGVFNNPNSEERNIEAGDPVTPLDIIRDIMEKYVDIPYNENNFCTTEIKSELEQLNHKIGILYDKQQTVFEAIEKLQSGGVLGFQFLVYQDRYTARLDNPNRPLVDGLDGIRRYDILNLDEVEVDWNADLYGTQTDIEYAHNYNEDSGRHWIGDSRRQAILDIHRMDKVWSASTLLKKKKDAELKSNIMLEDFVKLRPLIKNIKLFGLKWFGLRVYDIVFINLSLEEKSRNRIMEREFAGKETRCQILRVECDTSTGETTIDVRVREESDAWREA